ncbi:unknown [Bacteroides sp. CAG:875]|nr:unknown [Bacteroides sp. CAG:875]
MMKTLFIEKDVLSRDIQNIFFIFIPQRAKR